MKRAGTIPTQVFLEACVLFDPREDLRVYACRGADFATGQSLDALLGLDAEEAAFLWERTPEAPLSLVCGKRGVVFVFSALYKETGLLLGLIPKGEAEEICAAMMGEEYADAMLSPAARRCAERGAQRRESADEACLAAVVCAVTHVLRYLHPDDSVTLGERTRWLASFAGCPVEMPTDLREKEITVGHQEKMTAYLLCLFLAMRGSYGHLLWGDCAEVAERTEGDFRLEWHAAISVAEGERILPAALGDFPDFDFLGRSCFKDIHLLRGERGLLLRVRSSAHVEGVRTLPRERVGCAVLWIRRRHNTA